MACSKNDYETVELLLSKKVDFNLLDKEGHSAFYYSYFNNDAKMLKLLSDGGVRPVFREEVKNSPLYKICRDINAEKVGSLLELYGANEDLLKAVANAMLYEACTKHDYKNIKLLLENGASAHITKSGKLPKEDISFSRDEAIIHENAIRQDISTLDLLIKAGGIDVNYKDKNGASLISKVCNLHNLQAVELLLSQGAKPCGDHAIYKLLQEGRGDIVKLLLENGASVNFVDSKGKSIMDVFLAGKNIDPAIGELLSKAKAVQKTLNQDKVTVHASELQGAEEKFFQSFEDHKDENDDASHLQGVVLVSDGTLDI